MTSSVRHVDQEYEYCNKGRQRMDRKRGVRSSDCPRAVNMAVIMIYIDGNYNSGCKDIVLAIKKA